MKKVFAFLLFLHFFFAGQALAAPTAPGIRVPATDIETSPWTRCLSGAPGGPQDVATLACVPIVLQNIVNFLALFAGVVAVLLIIYAGFKFVTSQGDPEKVAGARRTMIFVLWGSIIVAVSFAILQLISRFTGVSSIAPIP